MLKQNYYEFFGLTNFEPDPDKIKRAYRSMALKHHPDRNQNKEDAEHMMKQVGEVYRILSKHKDEYDQHLKEKMGLSLKNNYSKITIVFGNGTTFSTDGNSFYQPY